MILKMCLLYVFDCHSIVEPARIIVALAVKMGHARAGRLRRPPRRPPLLPRLLLSAASTTTSITEKIRVSLHTLAIGRPVQLQVNTTATLTWSSHLQYLTLGHLPRITAIRSVPLLQLCQFVTIRIIKLWLIRGGLLGRKSFSALAAPAWAALGLVSPDNYRTASLY